MRRLASRKLAALAVLLSGALALSSCGSIYDLPLPGGADVGSKPMKVHVMFRDVLDLVPQSTVKVDDVTVGKVSAVKLHGYVADVTVELPKSTKLPDNAEAQIRQTSLLGEKFISLNSPENPGSGRLGNGDVIPLSRSGRNVEVEEVFSALALLLNGGGVGQLKTIASELNTAVGGRETDVRSVLDQIHVFTGQLDQNKVAIVNALENVNGLSKELRKQDGTVKSALDNLPAAIRSVNSQRQALVQTLGALSKLSSVGTQVIAQSKAATINTLQDLSPVLTQFAKAGQDLPKSLQILLTYPFLDAAVGNDPQVARNLHIGDYVNLSARLDVNLGLLNDVTGGKLGTTCKEVKAKALTKLDDLIGVLTKGQVKQAISGALDCDTLMINTKKLNETIQGLLGKKNLTAGLTQQICDISLLSGVCTALGQKPATAAPGGSGGGAGSGLGGLLGGLGLGGLGLGRAAPFGESAQPDPYQVRAGGFDPGIGTLLLQGVAATS